MAVLWPVFVEYTVALKPWRGSTRRERLPIDWGHIRKKMLKSADGLCQIRAQGCTVTATAVDHIVSGDDHRLSNLQATCGPCHIVKTNFENKVRRTKKMAARKRPTDSHPGQQ